MAPRRGLVAEIGPMVQLSIPVILAEIGWIAMALVDTAMVGGLGPEAIGAVSIGGTLNFAASIFGMGLLLGLDTVVAQAFGAGRADDGRRSLIQGLYLALATSLPLTAIQMVAADGLAAAGVSPTVAALTGPYMKALAWGTLPLLILGAFRRYLQAVHAVRPIMIALVSANLINWFGNWLLIRGHLGLPALGVLGSGWSTTAARAYMAGVLILAAVIRERSDARPFWRVPLGPDARRLHELIRLGLPAAAQITLEVGLFALATTVVGRFPAASLAAHQVALNLSSLTFMVPLGISSAGSVRVGHAVGRGDPAGAAAAGWAAILLGVAVMACSAIVFVAAPGPLARGFTDDPETIAIATRLIRLAAGFQMFDGLQVVATGVLRGAGDTRSAMLTGLLAHGCVGVPMGAWLALGRGWGVVGIWVGLASGLITAAVVLLVAWVRRVVQLRHGGLPAEGSGVERTGGDVGNHGVERVGGR